MGDITFPFSQACTVYHADNVPPHRRQDNFGRQSPETQRPWVRLLVGRTIIVVIINLSRSFLIITIGSSLHHHDVSLPVCF